MVSRFPVAEEFVSLRDAMDRLLQDSFVGGPFRSFWSAAPNGSSRMPLPLDVYATGDEVFVIAAVPGLRPEDIEITINQGTVTLSGKTPNVAQSEEAKNATWYLHELPHGTFTRSVTLPIEVDSAKADATFEQGILRLRLPKAEQAKPKQIKVRVAGAAESEAIAAGEK
ncbi:MAG TPA: Hsp20/alpha crystallin family protein [Thermomicrobiales bacterium]|jgi:HSP20 family protein